MAVSVYGLGKGGRKKKGEKSHAEVGKENIRSLVTVFRRHAIGSEDDMHLNHVGFRSLCQDLWLGSHDISNRLFAAMDAENTGVLDVHEFWTGMRRMHDTASVDRNERVEFAFNLFNIERNDKGELDSRVDRQELVGFLTSFYTEACDLRSGWLRRWIDHFETIFGQGVASAHTVGRASATRWEQTAAPLQLEDQSNKEVRNAARSFCDSVLELVRLEKSHRPIDDDEPKKKKNKKKDEENTWDGDDDDDHSLGRAGFMSWCDARDKKLQLRVLPWLEELGAAWLQRSSESPEERKLDGLASTTLGFAVERRPNGDTELKQKLEALQDEQIHVLFRSHSSNGLMANGDFDNWLIELGVSNPYLRGRLFAMFDRDSDRFIDFDEFHDGLRKLIIGKSKVELAFSLFDVDANGTFELSNQPSAILDASI
jgi:Ca2+-binding EF-hand superfamily protein